MNKPHIVIWILLFSCLVFDGVSAESKNLSATLYTAEQGLSSTKVTSITQDAKGFIWVGTEDGLNKFDGYTFTVYKNRATDSLSVLSDHISALYTDSNNRLWVATIEGLQYYNDSIDGFIRTGLNLPAYIIEKNECVDIREDSQGNLWFVSSGLGVVRYSPKTEESLLFTPSHTHPETTLCSRYIRTIEEDHNGDLWFGSSDNGISVFNPPTQTFTNYHTQNSSLPSNAIFDLRQMRNGQMAVASISGGVSLFLMKEKRFVALPHADKNPALRSVFCITEDSNGNLLIGSEGYGLLVYDSLLNQTQPHPMFAEMAQSIGDAKIHCIYEDKLGTFWIGMHYAGLCTIREMPSGFTNFRKSRNNPNSLSYGHIMGITTDKENNIWIATDGGGLNFYDRKTGHYRYYKHDDNDPYSLPDNAVVSVFCDSKNRIWAGTYTGGVCMLDKSTGRFIRYQADGKPGSLQSNFVKGIIEDKKGTIWIGTNGGGLYKLNERTGRFKVFRNSEYQGLINDHITKLFIDSHGKLWVPTFFGLSCMDIDTETFASFGAGSGLSNLSVYSVAEDDQGTIWGGTQNGLNRYNREKNVFERIYPNNPQLSPVINGIVPVKNQLWLSTNSGIVRYSPLTDEYKEFKVQDGLQSNEFILASYFKSPQGEIFFGGVSGFNAFFPDNIQDNLIAPVVYLTNLRILNQPVQINEPVDGTVVLSQSLANTKAIRLKHTAKSFTLEFTAPGTPEPTSIIYAYKMEGFDQNWIESDHTRRYATYTNLDPGTYTFRVKASNHRESWGNTETALTIEILPPFWATWWAKFFYLIVAVGIVFLVLRFAYIRIRERNELRIERLKAKQQEDLNQTKMNFFTNISHEFRTPLTLIISPLEKMLKEEKDEEKRQVFNLMHRNAERLLRLINQILELRKLEQGKMKLHVQEIEAVSFVSSIVGSFGDLAERKKIALTYEWNPDKIYLWYDSDMLDKCIYNILSNAFKYTPKEGKIHVKINQDTENICLTIQDTGIGMDEATLQRMFERFYQGEDPYTTQGSGIGMHLTKNIVEQHGGTITAISEKGVGTTVTLRIVPGKAHFKPEEIDQASSMDIGKETMAAPASPEKAEGDEQKTEITILLVEDDEDMRNFIISELKNEYRIETAVNGKQGLAKTLKGMPDLIITDVMMPEMNGIELCRLIKKDQETCHIPVIMLTAQGSIEHRIEGLESGADSYIPKPFNMQHLKTRIEKLIELRRSMKERFSKSLKMEAQEITVTSTDERLLQQVIDYIRKQMENTELSVEGMSKDLGISRTHLHRKLKALTGQSPVDFIRTIRMKQAAYLLSTGKLSVSEVGYKVGYNTPSYFSSCFSAHFGVSPTQYMEQAQHKDVTET